MRTNLKGSLMDYDDFRMWQLRRQRAQNPSESERKEMNRAVLEFFALSVAFFFGLLAFCIFFENIVSFIKKLILKLL